MMKSHTAGLQGAAEVQKQELKHRQGTDADHLENRALRRDRVAGIEVLRRCYSRNFPGTKVNLSILRRCPMGLFAPFLPHFSALEYALLNLKLMKLKSNKDEHYA